MHRSAITPPEGKEEEYAAPSNPLFQQKQMDEKEAQEKAQEVVAAVQAALDEAGNAAAAGSLSS